ncbi:MAG TPA: tetratricopeptide repeat protein [Thermosynechococcaceae cyanobacterium]
MRRGGQWIAWTYLAVTLTGAPLLNNFVMPAQAQAVPAEVRDGYVLLGRNQVQDAIALFQSAIQRYPQSVEARLGIAIAYRRNGQDANAFQAYEQVLTIDPNNALALKSIGLLGGYRPEWQARGVEAVTTLLNLNPNDLEARAQRALLYGYQGRFAESLADYQIALQGNPTPEVILGAAQVYTYNGNYARGLELFDRYRQTGKPIEKFAAVAYSRALRSSGSPSQAVQLLENELAKSNKVDELNIQLRSELSQAYLANNQQAQALEILSPLRGRSDALLPLARGLNELGKQASYPALSTEAAGLYRQALAQTTNPPATLLQEAADVLSGQPQEQQFALQLYRQAAQIQPADRALQIKRLALENELGFISKNDLRQSLQSLLQPLPTEPGQQQAIAQALVRVDPDPSFLSVYQTLLQSGAAASEPFLNFRVAQILIEQNDLASARSFLAAYTATPQGRSDLAPQLLAAEIERREGNLDAGARRYEALVAAKPSDDILLAALRGLAGIRLAQGRTNEALQLYDQLVARNPQDLRIQLGRTSVAYQAKQVSDSEAEAVLNNWLRSRPATDTPPELFSLVGALPPNPQREPLYTALAQADPNYLPIQLRYVQAIAQRSPAEARIRVNQLIARSRASGNNDVNAYLLQAQLAQAVGDSTLAGQAYQTVITQQPDNISALTGLGDVRFQQRRFSAAEGLYSQAIALNPNDVGIRRSLIEVNVAQDFRMRALQDLEQLQLQQTDGANPGIAERMQKIEEDFLVRRGFQPPWERY